MTNMDINSNFAKNLSERRKELGLTQADLAEKINYSDKAVSKWERGEAIPDVYTLKMLSDLFGTSIDNLISEPKKIKITKNHSLPKKRLIISLCATGIVWLVAIFAFAFINIIFPKLSHTWLALVYAIPVTTIVLLVLTSVWGKNLCNAIFLSILAWTTILSVYLTINLYLPSPPRYLWEIFLIGIPFQCLIIFWLLYKKVK